MVVGTFFEAREERDGGRKETTRNLKIKPSKKPCLFGGGMKWDHEKGQILKVGILVVEEHGLFSHNISSEIPSLRYSLN